MPTLNIQGRKVKVDDSFLKLSAEEQADTVDEIASQLGIKAGEDASSAPEGQASKDLRAELSAITQNPTKALYDQRPGWQKPLIAAQDIADLTANGITQGFGNKAAAAGRSLFTGNSYDDELEAMTAKTQAARDRAGYAGLTAEIGGGIATPAALASKGVTLAGRFGSGAAQGAKGLAARAGLLGVEGAGYGAVSAVGNDTDVGTGMLYGGIGGAAVPVVGGFLRAAAKPVADAVRARVNPAGFATEKVAERLGNMSPQQAANRMAANPGSSLADVGGPSARTLLRTATNIPGKAKDAVNARLTLRQFGQGDRLKDAIGKTFADPDGYLAAKDKIAEDAMKLASPVYQQAYARPVHFSETLEGILETPAGKQALRHAETLAGNEQAPFKQMFVNILDDGGQVVRRVPDTRGWDYIKRSMDDMIEAQRDSITKKYTNEGRILIGLRNKMLDEVDRLNPTYAQARSIWAGKAELDDALEAGRDVFKASPAGFKATVANMGPSQRAAARIGAAETLRGQIDAAGVTNNAILRIFSKPQQMRNLQTLFETPEQFKEFRKTIFAEARKRSTYEAVKNNSSTVAQAADMAEAGGLKETFDTARTAVTQGPVNATLQWLGSRLKMLGGMTPEVADNVSRQLLASNPQARSQIVANINRIEKMRATAEQKRQAIQAFMARSLAVSAGGGLLAAQ